MARKPKQIGIWDQAPTDPQSLLSMAHRYLQWMQVKNYSRRSVDSYRYTLKRFLEWCDQRCITAVNEVSTQILHQYQSFLYHYRTKRNRPLALKTRFGHLSVVCQFLGWLTKHSHLLYNPAGNIQRPKYPESLPPVVLTQQEAEQIINQADIKTPLGVRDRAIMELLYSCGIRASELAHLTIEDVQLNQGLIMIVQGKGQKDRLIPLGDRAGLWLSKYILQVRCTQTNDLSERILFLGKRAKPLSPNYISCRISKYVQAADIGKIGSCHLFRHSMATLMLNNGADIRYIQEILGHTRLSTTELYTRVNIKKLKQIHTLTHPGNRYQEDNHAPQEHHQILGHPCSTTDADCGV